MSDLKPCASCGYPMDESEARGTIKVGDGWMCEVTKAQIEADVLRRVAGSGRFDWVASGLREEADRILKEAKG